MAAQITSVDPGSPAARAGVKAGERLRTINGHGIQDVLDYKFYSYDPRLTLTLEGETGVRTVTLEKGEGEELGLNFETYLMDRQKSCGNKCVFCFIDQLPQGMRPTLYFKDDDARLSFLLGNYISLTNLSEQDVERMIRMRISPIHVSVHTMNPALRCRMLGNPRAGAALDILRRLAAAGLAIHCQLVICKGLNDGEELAFSLRELGALHPAVRSISVVPVGLTRYREGLYPLEPIGPEDARDILAITEAFGENCLRTLGTRLAYASDEIFIKAGRPLPESEYYEDFAQFENGVGMLSLFCEEFRAALRLMGEEDGVPAPFTIATGQAAAPFLSRLIDECRAKCHNLEGEVVAIPNRLFGEGVTVAGLICGQDLIAGLAGRRLRGRVLISANMLRDGGDVFLDDLTLGEVSRRLGVPVVPVEIDGGALVDAIWEETGV